MSSPRDWRPRFEQQTARINVDDTTWLEFRQRCLETGEHVSEALGRLVTDALDDRHREPAVERPPTRPRPRVTDTPRLFE